MEYLRLARAMEEIESSPSLSGRVSIAAGLISQTPEPMLYEVVRLLTGEVTFPWKGEFMGADVRTVSTALCEAGGFSTDRLAKVSKDAGELGLAAKRLLARRIQSTLSREPLSCPDVYGMLRSVAAQQGDGAQKRKEDILRALFTRAEPLESLYLVRTVLDRSIAGLSSGLAGDSIALAFKASRESVRRAGALLPDFGEVATHARDDTLKEVELEILRPARPQPMQPVMDIQMEKTARRLMLSARYGGAYIQIHRAGDTVRAFTRGLWEVGKSLVELLPLFKNLHAETLVVEGEIVASDARSSLAGIAVPSYVDVSHRLGRKRHHDSAMRNFPLRFYAGDILYHDGTDLTGRLLNQRQRVLKRLARRGRLELPLSRTVGSQANVEKFIETAKSGGARSVAAIDPGTRWIPTDGGRYLLRLPARAGKRLI